VSYPPTPTRKAGGRSVTPSADGGNRHDALPPPPYQGSPDRRSGTGQNHTSSSRLLSGETAHRGLPKKKLADWLARYARRLCDEPQRNSERVDRMNQANPKYVLRNYLAQLAIDKVDEDDFSLVKELLEVLRNPYEEQPEKERFAHKRPELARHRPGCSMLSCTS